MAVWDGDWMLSSRRPAGLSRKTMLPEIMEILLLQGIVPQTIMRIRFPQILQKRVFRMQKLLVGKQEIQKSGLQEWEQNLSIQCRAMGEL